jgi:SAM-dependent methyltransferase
MSSIQQNPETGKQESTAGSDYTRRLADKGTVWWKRLLDVQAPYRWNLRRLQPGFTLDIGCGLGRNLIHLKGQAVGIDHNPYSVEVARSHGLQAFVPEEFEASGFYRAGRFDSFLLSHVAEHMTAAEAVNLLTGYLPLLKPQGRVILITPQESGYRSDPTHVQFLDFASLQNIACEAGLLPLREFSFPFPRPFGRLFKYNEFILVARKP